MKISVTGGASLILISLATTAAHAGTVLDPASASTNMGSYSAQYLPTFAVNQSGISPGYTSGVTDFATYTATANTGLSGGSGFNTWYSAQGVLTGNFDFDLGGAHTIDAFALWNDPQSAGQGINQFNLLASNDSSFSSTTSLGSFTAVEGLGSANLAQVFSFAATSASYVRVQIVSNHGSSFVTGISEAAFDQVAVPVPGAAWLFGSALGLLGLRRRAVA